MTAVQSLSSDIYLRIARDLKRVHSHLVASASPARERPEFLEARLVGNPARAVHPSGPRISAGPTCSLDLAVAIGADQVPHQQRSCIRTATEELRVKHSLTRVYALVSSRRTDDDR
jgi:hypothetical protein